MIDNLSIEVFVGEGALKYLDYISEIRIETFKEYPYLYVGEKNYEKQYMEGYTKDEKSTIVIAKINGEIAGISTGIPLISDSEIVADAKKAFEQENIDPEEYYYYGEVIVLPKFRGMGLTRKLFEEQDKTVKEWGYKHICILTVIREEDHPLKPKDYDTKKEKMPWRANKFSEKQSLTVDYHWPTRQADGSVKDCQNRLQFWFKDLSRKPEEVIPKFDKSIGDFNSKEDQNTEARKFNI